MNRDLTSPASLREAAPDTYTSSNGSELDYRAPLTESLSNAWLRATALAGAALTVFAVDRAALASDHIVLGWTNPNYGFGYTNQPNGWTNVQLRLWTGSASNHFDRFMPIPSSVMTNAQVIGLQDGTRTYFTLTSYIPGVGVQSPNSNVIFRDSPAGGNPTPIRRDASTPTSDISTLQSGSFIIPDASTPLTLGFILASDGRPELTVMGAPSKQFVIQRSRTMNPDSWETIYQGALPPAIPGFLPATTFVDSDPAFNRNNSPAAFYRAVQAGN